ncbi:putative membrane protein [Candidatus Burkholderia verschuerenii]|uniref:Putative membrane protein n=1 Tax=Candidatus Burkholderia verschuerenii TaxID=242163 RepID=A0A0L0MD57_9BURK|nr:putative membrane protein [Candidatus Burkholderia verschuerenii]
MSRTQLVARLRAVYSPASATGRFDIKRLVAPALTVLVGVLLLIVFQHLSRAVDYKSVIHALRITTPAAWAAALFATALSFAALVGRDFIGLRHIGVKVPSSLLWVGATVGSALGNVTGFGALTGGAVRCRVYGAAEVTPAQVGLLSIFTGATLALSLAFTTAVGMVFSADTLSGMMRLSPAMLETAGTALLCVFVAMVIVCGREQRTLQSRVKWLSFTIPTRRDFVAQTALAVVDVFGAGLALWALLPMSAHVSFADFMTVFSAAMLLGMIGHTPGGVGVFEAAMVFALGGSVQTPDVLAALLAYRAIYFGLPLILSAGVMAVFEGRALKGRFAFLNPHNVSQLAPVFLSIVTFAAGSMLVISGATPAFKMRIALLQIIVPLWVLESSQLLGSVLGVLLLFVARGLMRWLDAAWWLAIGLAVANLLLSLAKGLAFVEVGVLAFLVVLLIATRERFNRRSSLFAERFTMTWLFSIGMVMAVATWIMFFAFRDVPYQTDLWWQFAFDERAPRALRATLAAGVFASAFAVWQLLRPAAGRFVKPAPQDLADASRIFRAQERSDAGLAMMGDKSFLFSESRQAFLMYAKHGRTWAALHDPVGLRDEWAALIRKFVELAHAHNGRAAFYQVRADALPLYLAAGLMLMKLGEEAHVALADFDLKGSHRSHLRYALCAMRYALKRGERDNFDTEVIGPDRIVESMPILRAISDDWLDSRSAREKSFSVAAFNDEYQAAIRAAGASGGRAGRLRHLHDDRHEHRGDRRRDAPCVGRVAVRDGIPLYQARAASEGSGFQVAVAGDRAVVGHGADAAGIALASSGRAGVALRRPFL